MEHPTNTYCDAVLKMPPDSLHQKYHDHLYGYPLDDDDELFGRLLLEINQAGLSWTTILKKEENFRAAYSSFSIAKVAQYNEEDRARLLADAGIIRNRLKVEAAIYNAGVIVQLQQQYGSFQQWLAQHHPLTRQEWTKLFKKTFKFTGGEIVNEFLMSSGYLPGAHVPGCRVYEKVAKAGPAWLAHNLDS